MTTPLSAAGLLGRQAELAGLRSLLEGPGGGAMVVLGEAGSGKTALLEAAAALAEDREVRVLRVTGYGAESRYPFAGLHQLLLPVLDELARVGDAPGRVLSRVFGLNVPVLELPGNAARPTDAGSRAEGPGIAEVGDVCLRLLRYLNSRQRTLVVVDDLQWLDGESAHALSIVCRRLQVTDVDLLIAVRGQAAPEELGIRTREYPLAPLAPGDARTLLARTAATLSDYALDTVLRQAAGNPLALVEFGKAVAVGPPERLGVFDDGPLPLSERLEALYSARTRDLPPPTRRALLLASAAGTNELADALASGRITIGSDAWILAAEAGLVTPDIDRGPRVPRFVHPLMRSAVFQSASYAEQADAHRVLAMALTAYPERHAWHLAQSVWHPDEAIAALLEATARQMEARSSFHAAAAAYERAAELSPVPRNACRRLTLAAVNATEATQRAWSLRLAERAVAIGSEADLDASELAQAREYIGHGKVYLGADANLVRDLLSALATAAVETRFHTARLAGIAATASYYAPMPDEVAELRTVLNQLPDPFLYPQAWDQPRTADAMLTYARYSSSPFLPRKEPLPDHGILDRNNVELYQDTGRSMFGAAAYLLDQPELAAKVLETHLRQWLAEHGGSADLTLCAVIASNNMMWGRWDEAVSQADEAIELATERGERFNLGFGHITAGMLAVRQGRLNQARRHARAADGAGDGVSLSIPARTRHLYGLISLTEGDYETAYTLLRGTLLTDEHVPAHYHLSHYAVADFALAAQHTGQQDDAAYVLDGIMAHADAMTPGGAHPSRRLRLLHDLARALIADPAHATALFQQVLSPGAERWPFDQACARLHFGEHLRRRRRIAEARPLLTAALETFRALGALPWAQRAETELQAAGATPESAPVPDDRHQVQGAFAALTPQQRAVAQLAARGLTNPQIGARLSLSPKTVGIHLSRVFEQLGLTSRAQLRDLGPGDVSPPSE